MSTAKIIRARCKKCDEEFNTPTMKPMDVGPITLTPRCPWCGSFRIEQVPSK